MTDATNAAPEFDLTGLVPDVTPAAYPVRQILLTDLPAGSGGRFPDADFRESVERQGILQPIVVQQGPEGYLVVDGWKRIAAARSLELAGTIPAVILPGVEGQHPDVLTLAANNLRSDNLTAEYRALARLMEEHGDLKKIAAATGIKYQTLYRIWKLRKLDGRLLDALEAGQINAWSAEHAARYPDAEQQRLVELIESGEKVTSKMVVDMRRQRVADRVRQAALESPDLFAAPDLGLDDEADEDQDLAEELGQDQLADVAAVLPTAGSTVATVEAPPAAEPEVAYLRPIVRPVSAKVAAKQEHKNAMALAHLQSALALLDAQGKLPDALEMVAGLAEEAITKLQAAMQ